MTIERHYQPVPQPPNKHERMEIRKKLGYRKVQGFTPPAREGGPAYLTAHACFDCRKSWKLSEESEATCPDCGEEAHYMGRSFKAPKKSDVKQWRKVELLWLAGFRFHTNTRSRKIAPYPEHLREVEKFILDNPDHPFREKR
ncbi:hypothetical protein [Qipengyuania sphaerica]|uniref:hypothetical protein n=1 Tax=Qipengyuania sphaerica TaxID=2867243 RepID=UPI001C86B6D3|nr:hypothetical protein [Qipengyuania sphaerica]MBX7539655.1 hypothetical protein [Qipengyuania sphaerica]